MRVLTIVGARPQFIKAAPVSRVLAGRHEELLVHTGQHYDETLSAIFFDELGMGAPDYQLAVGSGPTGEQIGTMMRRLGPLLHEVEPDVVLVYGDTHSTLAAAIVAAHADTLLAHVEAGLRSGNRSMPEEVNRVLTDHASDMLFAPTERAVTSLAEENIEAGVHLTGDVMVDSLAAASSHGMSDILERLSLTPNAFVVATIHRAANTDDRDRLTGIMGALTALEDRVVLPLHPRTKDRLEATGQLEWVTDNIEIIEPVGYLDFVTLLEAAAHVITDSGGVQKEAFLLKTPCVTLRTETEWPETLNGGWNVLAEPSRLQRVVDRSKPSANRTEPFGIGQTAERIVDLLDAAVEHGEGIRPIQRSISDRPIAMQ